MLVERGYHHLFNMVGGFQGADHGPPLGVVEGWEARGFEMTRVPVPGRTWEALSKELAR